MQIRIFRVQRYTQGHIKSVLYIFLLKSPWNVNNSFRFLLEIELYLAIFCCIINYRMLHSQICFQKYTNQYYMIVHDPFRRKLPKVIYGEKKATNTIKIDQAECWNKPLV